MKVLSRYSVIRVLLIMQRTIVQLVKNFGETFYIVPHYDKVIITHPRFHIDVIIQQRFALNYDIINIKII